MVAKGKAAGTDGLPYELWLLLWNRSMHSDNGIKRADIVEIFCIVFNDIAVHGVTKDTSFCVGWICPLYKKKD